MSNRTTSPGKRPDAGLRSLEHYQSRLPRWRFNLREYIIPYLRWETPYVAKVQQLCRTPFLDAYFAYTANLGTHTFFMIMLPILFYCGHVQWGRAMTQMLASGVLFSGFVKDMMCLPRPLSPPLQRITRSAHVALEYGFPSTHSTNAMSVVVYAIHAIRSSPETSATSSFLVQLLLYLYATSIVIGRVYCGMHGFIDVVCGAVLGGLIGIIQAQYGAWFDEWIGKGPFSNVLLVVGIVIVLVRIHPEPADDCPCFDDSVSFSGVFIGIQLGDWGLLRGVPSLAALLSRDTTFSLQQLGYVTAMVRILLGVLVIFLWRGIMKPSLLKMLPPVFRVVEKLGLSLPRRFFLRASQYGKVPPLRKDDRVIPSISEIPSMIDSLRNPRKRTVSIGAQSEADAYEAMAYRAHQRRRSKSTSPGPRGTAAYDRAIPATPNVEYTGVDGARDVIGSRLIRPISGTQGSPEVRNSINEDVLLTPTDEEFDHVQELTGFTEVMIRKSDDKADREMFRKLHVPRVRYDVEVVTKLVVYTGIGWLAAEFNPLLFELVGLGVNARANIG